MSDLYRLHDRTLTIADEGEPLYAALPRAVEGLSRAKARLAITAGLVRIDDQLCSDPQRQVQGSCHLQVDLRQGIPSAGAQKHSRSGAGRETGGRPFSILHQDDELIVIDKAAGILSAPTDHETHGHAGELLRDYFKKQGRKLPYIGQVHRIDSATSGCLCFALTKKAQELLSLQFSTHAAERRYRCLVRGGPRQDSDSLSGKIGRGQDGRRAIVPENKPGKLAITHFEVVRRYEHYSDLSVRLETGRTHQVRVQMANIACPILGDELYGFRPARGKKRRHDGETSEQGPRPPKVQRLMLHAVELHLDHPADGRRLVVTAPLPKVYQALIA